MAPWWRRPFVRPAEPTTPPLQRLVADLHRLETEVEHLLDDATVLARGQRLIALRIAFDLVLIDAAHALDVPLPHDDAPFSADERFQVSIDLTAAGLRW